MKQIYFDDLESRLTHITRLESFDSYCLTLELKNLQDEDILLKSVEIIIDDLDEFNDENLVLRRILEQPEFKALNLTVLGYSKIK